MKLTLVMIVWLLFEGTKLIGVFEERPVLHYRLLLHRFPDREFRMEEWELNRDYKPKEYNELILLERNSK